MLNLYGDQPEDVSRVRWWVVCFSSGDSDVKDKPHSGWLCTVDIPQNEEHLDQLMHAIWQISTKELRL